MSVGLTGHTEWDRIKKRLRAELGEDVFTSWFARVDLESLNDGILHLSVPTRFLKNWLQSRYLDRLRALWQEEFGDVRQIEFSVRSAMRPRVVQGGAPATAWIEDQPVALAVGQSHGPQPHALQGGGPRPLHVISTAQTAFHPAFAGPGQRPQREPMVDGRLDLSAEESLAGSPLDPRYNFEQFIEGRSNGLALAAARRVADSQPGDPVGFNPLFIHASVGLGKTHLLQAVANQARANRRRVLYLTADHFMYRFVAALKSQSAIAFKDGLRAIDLLLIDDLQFMQGKQIQQEFCHTLNSLIDGAHHVVVAADRPPVELESLDERVRSRLAGGLVVDIAAPDYELRHRIVASRVTASKRCYPALAVSEPVIEYVARNVTSSGRDLDAAVSRLVAHNQLTGEPISLDMAEMALRDLLRQKEARRVKIEEIQRVVCKQYNVTKADLLSSRRTRTVVRPRQIAMYLAKTLTPRSLPEIGRRFGNRDHTTVLHAVRKIEDMMQTDRGFADEVDGLRRQFDA